MQLHFQNNNSNELILFLNGWGMDERPFRIMKSCRDILFLSDYSSLDFKFNFSGYERIILISYSAGVYMASYLQDILPKFDFKIAVSGTLNLFDNKNGLSDENVLMMQNVSLENYMELRKKLILDSNQLEAFNENQPFRDIDSSLNELSALQKYAKIKVDFEFEFDKVIIGQNDAIIPYENQLRFWNGHKNTRIVSGGHFLFYNFNSFDEIVDL